jgi:heme-degrading monooxygenase HmoA
MPSDSGRGGDCGASPHGRRRTPGSDEPRVEFLTLSFWDSEDAIRGFAGEDIGKAVFYPEDDSYLVDREERVQHYEVHGS